MYSPFFFFFFNDTATTEIYTLSLHDALPISLRVEHGGVEGGIESSVSIRSECFASPSGQPVVERVIATAGPLRGAEVVPTRGFSDERALNFGTAPREARGVLSRCQRAIIEQGFVNAIGDERAVIWMALAEKHREEAAGPIAGQTTGRPARRAVPRHAIIGAAEPAVRVVEIEFEAAA